MIDVEWLDAFVGFAEQLNFTRAARDRHISQPALHLQVKKLEEGLGAPLYRKRGRSLELTDAGHRTLAFGREIRERMREFQGELHADGAPLPAVLAAGEGAYLYLLGEAIRRFTSSGASRLRLLTRDHAGAVEAVATGEAQLGVASLDVLPDGLTAELLTRVGQALMVPADHPLAGRRSATIAELDGARLVVPPNGRPHRAMLTQAFAAAGASFDVAVEAGGWELMLHFVRLGVGVAVVNACCRAPAGLVAVPMPELPVRAYHLLRRPSAPLRGPVAALHEALLAAKDAWRSPTKRAGGPAA